MSIRLHYFDVYGAAEGIRMVLNHAKIEFEDVRYTREKWAEAKPSGNFEFGQMPAIEYDGKFYAQSVSILRFLGRKHGYYSDDAVTAWRIDSTIDAIGDLKTALYKFAWEQDEEKKKEALKNFTENVLPPWLTAIEKRIEKNSS
jgi:glutathione S-transferase